MVSTKSGQEIYNFCKQEGIDKIVLMGVHTNICILNRGFGARQMTQLGFEVVLARDLTDAMYDPRTRPFVSHPRGTELVIAHIETMWCPSILSDDLTRVVPGSANPPHGGSLKRTAGWVLPKAFFNPARVSRSFAERSTLRRDSRNDLLPSTTRQRPASGRRSRSLVTYLSLTLWACLSGDWKGSQRGGTDCTRESWKLRASRTRAGFRPAGNLLLAFGPPNQ